MVLTEPDRLEVDRLSYQFVYAAKRGDRIYRSILTPKLFAYGVSGDCLDEIWSKYNS